MRARQQMALAASTLVALTLSAGCDESKPSASTSTTEASVKGVVKIDGKPANEGEIIFDSSNYQRQSGSRTAPIGKNGTYEIKTLVGLNNVKLGGTIARKSPVLQMMQRSFDVQNGDNTFDFEVSAK